MKTIYNVLGVLLAFLGLQSALLGTLYKIQSWQLPKIGSMTLDLQIIGFVIIGIGVSVVIAAKNVRNEERIERLQLRDDYLLPNKVKEPLHDDDLLV